VLGVPDSEHRDVAEHSFSCWGASDFVTGTEQNIFLFGRKMLSMTVTLRLTLRDLGRNPFAKMRSRGRLQRRRPMTDEEFQTLLRGSDPT
jgi:hypothetical protein